MACLTLAWSAGTGAGRPGTGHKSQRALGFGSTHRVLECQEAVANPAAGGPVTADVRESLVQVAVRSTKGYLFNGLVYQQVLGGAEEARRGTRTVFHVFTQHSFSVCSIFHPDWGGHPAVTETAVGPAGMGPPSLVQESLIIRRGPRVTARW